MVVENVFVEISLIVAVAVLVSAVLRIFKQPLIIGYIISGILVSPYFFNLVKSTESLETFAQMGVAVLLFMVGLNLDPRAAKDVGKPAIITGIGQILFTFGVAIVVCLALGFDKITSAYIAIAISFSSTIIIMKILSDKGDTNTLYGRISIGFLIVQDLVAIFLLMIISSLGNYAGFTNLAVNKFLIGLGLVGGLVIFSIFILKPATRVIAKSQELLLLFSIGWAFILASLFDYFGFSIEIGALLAGISLSISPFKHEISSRMKPLRDFFLLLFFILLGSQLSFGDSGKMILPVVILSGVILIGNPIIVMSLMGRMGYTKRTGFLCGLTVSQISEFSFILIALGVGFGHLSNDILSMMTLIGLITMGGSTYAMLKNDALYRKLSDYLNIFERKTQKIDEGKYHHESEYDIILFGYNRIGYSLKQSFGKMKKKFLIVDNNPEVIQKLIKIGVECRYGDAEDSEMLDELPLAKARMIVSTIPDFETNVFLLKECKRANKECVFLGVSHQIEDTLRLYDIGADYVMMPHFLGGDYTSHLIEKNGFDAKKFREEAVKNAKELRQRKREGHKDVTHERD